MKELKINHLAVLVTIVLQFALGFLWYGPLFGDPWMEMVGLDLATIEANPPGVSEWITNIISAVVSCYVLAWIFVRMNVHTLLAGAYMGLLIGFSFVLLSVMTSTLFAQQPYELAWITGGYTTVGLTIAGAVLGAWKSYKDQ